MLIDDRDCPHIVSKQVPGPGVLSMGEVFTHLGTKRAQTELRLALGLKAAKLGSGQETFESPSALVSEISDRSCDLLG